MLKLRQRKPGASYSHATVSSEHEDSFSSPCNHPGRHLAGPFGSPSPSTLLEPASLLATMISKMMGSTETCGAHGVQPIRGADIGTHITMRQRPQNEMSGPVGQWVFMGHLRVCVRWYTPPRLTARQPISPPSLCSQHGMHRKGLHSMW